MKVRALDSVDDDLLQAARRLEEARAGYGELLFAHYRRVLESLERFPRIHALVEDEIRGREFRNALLRRLKYRIVYEIRESEILVVAVLHTSRDEKLWHPRVECTSEADMRESTTAKGPAAFPPSPEVVNAILKWSVDDRRDLAILLQDSIREGFTSFAEAQEGQKNLIHARIAQLVSGEVETRDADEVLDELERRYSSENRP